MALFTSTLGRMCTQFGTVATNEASARAGLNDSLYVLVVLVEVGVLYFFGVVDESPSYLFSILMTGLEHCHQ